MHGLYGRHILLHNRFKCSFALVYVAFYAAKNANVGIGIDKKLYIHKISQALVCKNEYAVDNKHGFRLYNKRFIGAVVNGIVINGAVYRSAGFKLFDVLNHKVGVKSVGAVVILRGALFIRKPVLPFVIIVVLYNGHSALEFFGNDVRYCAFSAAGSACDAYNEHILHICAPRKTYLWLFK